MRRVLLALALVVATLPAWATPAQALPTFTFDGRGWGHGVGLSQYGARAMAVAGQSVDQILSYYYSGVTLRPITETLPVDHYLVTDPDPLWIGLRQNQTVLPFQLVGGAAGLCKANDGEGVCPTQFAQPGESWDFRTLGGGLCQFFRGGVAVGNPGTCEASITWDLQPSVQVVFSDSGASYARGTLRIRPAGTAAFHVVLETPIESYLYGLGEMPSDWPAAALQAQVVAARTYALRQAIRWGAEPNLDSGRRAACWCQLYGSVVDQNYAGYSKETAQYGANWVAAVDATAGRLISHPLAADLTVIIGYYSSSSGGMTESNVTGLGQTTLLPYLQSVNDPWSLDPFNPFANWTDPVTATDAASGLGLDSVTTMQITAWNPSGSVASVQVAGTLAGTVQSLTKTGRQIKSALGLRSSWFSVSAAETFFPPFKDDEGSVHEADIVSIWERSITQGCAADLYCPAETVTRWQMALFLTRLQTAAGFAIPPPAPQGFADIGLLPQAYQDAINQLKVMGITQGTSATTYAPDAVVTRWQMALFLTRLMSMDGLPLPDGSSQGYADIGHLSADSQRAVNQLRQLGVTVTDGAFEPDLKLPRDQMASFLARTLLRVDPL